jgi:translocation and assembly module TamB
VDNEIRVESFQALSGSGRLEGGATVRLKDWRMGDYEGRLSGERFQAVYLPELQVSASPQLNFRGTPERVIVRGEVRLPEVSILGRETKEVIRPSPDVVVVDEADVPAKSLPFALDIEVVLRLGDRVFVKAEGIDARLTGQMTLKTVDLKRVTADGEVRIAEGHYSAYGVKLEMARGRLIFADSDVENPALDVLAVKKIQEIQAGVIATGTLRKPVVRLYSRPAMPDTDILSYIVLGQPLGKGKGQMPSLTEAAAGLLSAGESVILQGKLKKQLGLDTLDVQTGNGEDLSRSMVTVGKYLSPKLYVSLGRSLFADATLLTLRYKISKRFEIETQTGTASGATLYYRVEFK